MLCPQGAGSCFVLCRSRDSSLFARRGDRPGWGGSRVIESFDCLAFQLMSHDLFQRADHVVVIRGDQGEGITTALGASSAPDAMDVGIGGIGHVEVDDVRNAVHVQAACGDVCGNHDLVLPILEAGERRLALALRTVAVQAGDFVTSVLDLALQTVSAMFGAGKNQYRVCISLFQQSQQEASLQMLRDRIERMRNSVRRAAETDRNAFGLFERIRWPAFPLRAGR